MQEFDGLQKEIDHIDDLFQNNSDKIYIEDNDEL